MSKLRKFFPGSFFYLLFCTSLLTAWYFHSGVKQFNDPRELWSDRAGYYIYLPALFFYHFDAREMPADLDVATGGGFSLDTVKNKIDTKYTYGVALMVSPFFALAHLTSLVAGIDDQAGFSMLYMRMMMLAAVVYLTLGLWLLYRFLKETFSEAVSLITCLLVFLGTPLLYYALADGMMSHVYSFFLFALFLFSLQKFNTASDTRVLLVVSVTLGLIVLIRPTNAILAVALLGYGALSGRGLALMRIREVFYLAGIPLLLFVPQMIYWKYLSGSWLHFSYRDEGFVHLRNPKIAEVLFSPVNGLIPYTPLVLAMMAGIIIMFVQKRKNRWLAVLLFAGITAICSTWKMWYFGCGYGQRSYIEYFTVLAVPLAVVVEGLRLKVEGGKLMVRWLQNLVRVAVMFLLMLMVYSNIRYVVSYYRFERCYYGSTWDWDYYQRTFRRAGVISPMRQPSSFGNDFENLAIFPGRKPSKVFTRSGIYSVRCEGKTELYAARLADFGYPGPKILDVELFLLKPADRPATGSLALEALLGDKIIFRANKPFDTLRSEKLTWKRMAASFIVPDVYDTNLVIRLVVHNAGKDMLFADDLGVEYLYAWKGAEAPGIRHQASGNRQ